MSQYLFLLLVLACPLMMIFMMRGHGHGHGASQGRDGHDHAGHADHADCGDEEPVSVDDLRRQRDELDRRIAEREWQGASGDDRSVERV